MIHADTGAAPRAGTAPLTEDQVAAFWRDGFMHLPAITTPPDVARIRELYDRLFHERRGWDSGDMFDFAGADDPARAPSVPQLLNPSRYEPLLAEALFRRNAAAVARQLLGPRAELVFEHAMLKPPRSGGETPWHQDEAFYAKYTNYEALTFWMPLQDVDRANGCMEFLPRSHKGPLLSHRSIGGDPRVHGLEAVGVDPADVVACPLPAGGVTIHHARTLHYAGPNRSAAPRRAYALGFGVRSRAATQRHEHPWNLGRLADRDRRRVAAQGMAGRALDWCKAVGKWATR